MSNSQVPTVNSFQADGTLPAKREVDATIFGCHGLGMWGHVHWRRRQAAQTESKWLGGPRKWLSTCCEALWSTYTDFGGVLLSTVEPLFCDSCSILTEESNRRGGLWERGFHVGFACPFRILWVRVLSTQPAKGIL